MGCRVSSPLLPGARYNSQRKRHRVAMMMVDSWQTCRCQCPGRLADVVIGSIQRIVALPHQGTLMIEHVHIRTIQSPPILLATPAAAFPSAEKTGSRIPDGNPSSLILGSYRKGRNNQKRVKVNKTTIPQSQQRCACPYQQSCMI